MYCQRLKLVLKTRAKLSVETAIQFYMSNPGIEETYYVPIPSTVIRTLLSYHIAIEAANTRTITGSGSENESDDEVGAQAPPLTKQISNILNRYPEGGQILKVSNY